MDEAIKEEDESMDAGGGFLFMTFIFIQGLMNCWHQTDCVLMLYSFAARPFSIYLRTIFLHTLEIST